MNVKDAVLIDKLDMHTVTNSDGLTFSLFDNGTVKSIIQGDIEINLLSGSPLEVNCCNLYLRKRADGIKAVPLLGVGSPAREVFAENSFRVDGEFEGLLYSCRLLLAEDESSWLWDLQITNTTDNRQELDLLYAQDVGLTASDRNEKNAFFVSQYIDYTVLNHRDHGNIICCRQNEHGPNCVPWLALGSLQHTSSFSTDGLQFFGSSYKEAAIPKCLTVSQLPGLSQRELAIVALQQQPFVLNPGQSRSVGFFGVFCNNHPAPTSLADLALVDSRLEKLKELSTQSWAEKYIYQEPTASLFSTSPLFLADDLNETDLDGFFGIDRRSEELLDGQLLSFFCDQNRHIVLRRKEFLVDRPHGHIMKTGTNLTPDDTSMSCSAYMFGVFQSHIAQGNVNFNRFLTLNTSPLNMQRHTGQRIFIRLEGQYFQLGVPSAFEISLNGCRWIYKQGDSLFELRSWAAPDRPEIILSLEVIEGPQLQWLISNELTPEHNWSFEHGHKDNGNEIFVFRPDARGELAQLYPDGYFSIVLENADLIEQVGGDELLFDDGKSRALSFFVIEIAATKQFAMRIQGGLACESRINSGQVYTKAHELYERDLQKANDFWKEMSCSLQVRLPTSQNDRGLSEIFEAMPWFAQNAQIHYLAPHGLEQYSGGAWGTRDTCQGPLEMLLSLGHFAQVRKILSTVFSNQNPDGNWPQWWMFDRYSWIRSSESHGDIIFWPILALSQYIRASNDYDFLDERLPFYSEIGSAISHTISIADHVLVAINHIKTVRFAKGTSLAGYSDGDWNDSMQPANSELKKQLISCWTVGLNYQAFKAFAEVCRDSGRVEVAAIIETLCKNIQNDFSRFLIRDGVVAGFGLANQDTNQDNGIDLLLHPSDSTTGIQYRLLPMIRGIISGIFTPEQAHTHTKIIEKHLKGPDGARLMDRPPKYHGGLQQYFKRAESCPFFGREIGIMYTHAHLRYAEAMAKLGNAKAFIGALRQVVPVAIEDIIPQANIRQSNCYYSSSDAGFTNRYEVNDHYDALKAGNIPLNGGWRIYSSGPGMFVRFVVEYLLGFRQSFGHTVFDPVLTGEYDGLEVDIRLLGRDAHFVYRVGGGAVRSVEVNGLALNFSREDNPYRVGGAVVDNKTLLTVLNRDCNVVNIIL